MKKKSKSKITKKPVAKKKTAKKKTAKNTKKQKAPARKGLELNRAGLAGAFGVSLPTIDEWKRRGAPFTDKPDGKRLEWSFNSAEVFKWYTDQLKAEHLDNSVVGNLKIRKLTADTERSELELAQANGDAISILDTIQVWQNLTNDFKTKCRNVGAKLSPMLTGEDDPVTIKSLIDSELMEALTELSKYEPALPNNK